jgi:hypothetical protein
MKNKVVRKKESSQKEGRIRFSGMKDKVEGKKETS